MGGGKETGRRVRSWVVPPPQPPAASNVHRHHLALSEDPEPEESAMDDRQPDFRQAGGPSDPVAEEVGAAVGAVGRALSGAVAAAAAAGTTASLAGPIGTMVGAVAGGVLGALAGRTVAEHAEPADGAVAATPAPEDTSRRSADAPGGGSASDSNPHLGGVRHLLGHSIGWTGSGPTPSRPAWHGRASPRLSSCGPWISLPALSSRQAWTPPGSRRPSPKDPPARRSPLLSLELGGRRAGKPAPPPANSPRNGPSQDSVRRSRAR